MQLCKMCAVVLCTNVVLICHHKWHCAVSLTVSYFFYSTLHFQDLFLLLNVHLVLCFLLLPNTLRWLPCDVLLSTLPGEDTQGCHLPRRDRCRWTLSFPDSWRTWRRRVSGSCLHFMNQDSQLNWSSFPSAIAVPASFLPHLHVRP